MLDTVIYSTESYAYFGRRRIWTRSMVGNLYAGVIKDDGKPCQSRVKPGSGPCMWHARTPKQKFIAWVKNKTLQAVATLLGLLIALAAFGGWAYDEFFKHPPVYECTPATLPDEQNRKRLITQQVHRFSRLSPAPKKQIRKAPAQPPHPTRAR